MSIIPSETRIENPKKEHNSTIIFFHGMTLNNNCVGHFNSNMQEEFPHTKFIFPQASRKEWKVKGMFSSENTNWYCIKTTRDHLFPANPPKTLEEVEKWGKEVEVNESHLHSLVFEVHKIIQTEIDNGIKPENIIIAGWSQGGSAALATGLTFKKQLGGIISLSSFLPWSPKTYDFLNNAGSEKKNVPIIFCNGTNDSLVPFWTGEMSAKILKLCGYSKVKFHGYQGQGHSTNCDKELYNFLEGILPRKRKETEEENNSNDLPKSKKPKIKEEPAEDNNLPIRENPESPNDSEKPQDKQKQPPEKENPSERDNDNNTDFENWTYEQIVSEIKKLGAEIVALKSDKTMDSLEKQKKLQLKLEKLEKAKANSSENSACSSNDFPTSWVIFGGGIFLVAVLIIAVFIKKKKKQSNLN